MLEVMLWSNYMRDHNMTYIDEVGGYVSEEWWWKNSGKIKKDKKYKKKIEKLIDKEGFKLRG